MSTQNISPHLSVEKIPHVLHLRRSSIAGTSKNGTTQHLANLASFHKSLHFSNNGRKRALNSNHGFGSMFGGEKRHFLGDGEVAVEGPFDEDGFSGDDAGFYCQEMVVDAQAADDEVDIWVGGKF